ncbi:hypothetical protein V6O07_16820, partial [Arthrospira platensis SPKY2]
MKNSATRCSQTRDWHVFAETGIYLAAKEAKVSPLRISFKFGFKVVLYMSDEQLTVDTSTTQRF